MNRGRRWAVFTAAAGTVFIAAGAFWLSFTALADLVSRSGIGDGQAWAWPLIVDGIIVVATVAVVSLAGDRAAWYPWALLIGGALVSVTANALHAVVVADASVPGVLAAAVAAVPPVVLLAITHLTVILTRHTPTPAETTVDMSADRANLDAARSPIGRSAASELALPQAATPVTPAPAITHHPVPPQTQGRSVVASAGRRTEAAALRAEGWSNKQIARRVGVHPSTVGRWFAHLPPTHTQPMSQSEGVSS